eukprot:908480-Pyramimonas_sp.AAC.1
MISIKKEPRKVLRNVGDAVLDLKTMIKDTTNQKYSSEVNADAAKLLPKFAALFKTMEKVALLDGGPDKDELLAPGAKVDECFESFNEVNEWYQKLCGKPPSKKQR